MVGNRGVEGFNREKNCNFRERKREERDGQRQSERETYLLVNKLPWVERREERET